MNKFKIELENPFLVKEGLFAIEDFYRTMAIEQLALKGILAFVTGINSPFLNVVLDTRADKTNSLELIDHLLSFFDPFQLPWAWFTHPGKHKNDLKNHGFSILEESPSMYFNLLNPITTLKIPDLIINEVEKDGHLKTWIQPINEGFEVKEGDEAYRLLNERLLKSHPHKMRHFVAYYQNHIAAAGTFFISDHSVMLHNLATKTIFTRKGIGTALTLYMMEQAKKLGFQHCFLDSSEDGFNLYRKIGFKVYSTTQIYSKL